MTTTGQAAQSVRIKNLGISLTLEDAVILAINHYHNIGKLKKAKPILNKVIARSNVNFGWKELIDGAKKLIKVSINNDKDIILKDWTFNQVLARISPLILENERFGRIALNTIAMGIFEPKNPITFVKKYSKYTDSNGVIYGKKTELENLDGYNNEVFVTRFKPISLTARNAAKILESAFENFMKIRQNAILDNQKSDVCYRVSNNQICAIYEVITAENGEKIKGERIK